MTRWLTIEKAADSTGLPASYFHERTSPTSGVWAEGVVWKWFEGRKLVDLEALYNLIDQAPSVASMRGRRRGAGQPAAQLQRGDFADAESTLSVTAMKETP